MVRELLPGRGLLLHEYMAPLGRVGTRVVREGTRGRGRTPHTHGGRAPRSPGPTSSRSPRPACGPSPRPAPARAHKSRLVFWRRGAHLLLLLRAQHLLLLLLQHFRLLFTWYTSCSDACNGKDPRCFLSINYAVHRMADKDLIMNIAKHSNYHSNKYPNLKYQINNNIFIKETYFQ